MMKVLLYNTSDCCCALSQPVCHIADRGENQHGRLRGPDLAWNTTDWTGEKQTVDWRLGCPPGKRNMERTESKATAEFTDLPVVTVHKRNIDKYKHQIVQDIQVNH